MSVSRFLPQRNGKISAVAVLDVVLRVQKGSLNVFSFPVVHFHLYLPYFILFLCLLDIGAVDAVQQITVIELFNHEKALQLLTLMPLGCLFMIKERGKNLFETVWTHWMSPFLCAPHGKLWIRNPAGFMYVLYGDYKSCIIILVVSGECL